MKNIILDGQTYNGISEVSLPISGGTALFKDKDEIPAPPSGSLSITANGTYDVTDKASAVVAVPAPEINLQNKTATANGEVTADEGYDGLGTVTVNVSGSAASWKHTTFTVEETSANNIDLSEYIQEDANAVYCIKQNIEAGAASTVGYFSWSDDIPNLAGANITYYIFSLSSGTASSPTASALSRTTIDVFKSFGSSRPIAAGTYDLYWI